MAVEIALAHNMGMMTTSSRMATERVVRRRRLSPSDTTGYFKYLVTKKVASAMKMLLMMKR